MQSGIGRSNLEQKSSKNGAGEFWVRSEDSPGYRVVNRIDLQFIHTSFIARLGEIAGAIGWFKDITELVYVVKAFRIDQD